MPSVIESNIIVRTKVPAPTGGGFKQIVKELTAIDRLLTKIERNVNIGINLSPQAQQVINTLKGAAGGKSGGGGGAGGGAPPLPGGGGFGVPGRRGSIERIISRTEGDITRLEDKFQALRAGNLLKRSDITLIDSEGNITNKERLSNTNLERQERARRDLAEEKFAIRQRLGPTQAEVARESNRSARQQQIQLDQRNQAVLKSLTAQKQADLRVTELLSQGYIVHKIKTEEVTKAGRRYFTHLTELRKVTGSAITGNLAIEIARVDQATGALTKTVVQGSEAIRLMGDRFSNAVAKVGLWLAATSVIFLMSRAAFSAAEAFQELEANTVFLARVGSRLAESGKFEDRLLEAKRLTKVLLEQNQALGGSVRESQLAAAAFARGGKTSKEVAEATEASILATSIAELKQADAAALLSSAQDQFGLSSGKLLGVLDSLNTLSNKYRVSTDDLLQSISRSGSVYSQANGSLEQLASTTAIIAQKTRRTGAEIGNALKTIISRLSSPETTKALLETTGITISDQEGQLKSFTRLLLELQAATGNLTDTEQQRIGVQIAGARQVNILRAALDNVVDVVLAEVEALRKEESAYSEAIQRSGTLDAALARLTANFEGVVGAGSSFGDVLTSIINTINFLLKGALAFDGLVIKIGLAVIGFITLRAVLVRVIPTLAQTAVASHAVADGMFAVLTASAAASGGVAKAGAGIFSVLSKLNIIVSLVSIGVIALATAFNHLEQVQVQSAIAAKEIAQQQKEQASNATSQRRAVQSLGDALLGLIEKQRELNKAREEGRPDLQKEQKNAKDVSRIVSALGIKVDGKDLQNEEKLIKLVDDYKQKRKEAFDADIKGREAEAKTTENSLLSEQQKIKQLEERKKILEDIVNTPRAPDEEGAAIGARLRALEELESVEKQLHETQTAVGQLQTRLLEIPKEIQDIEKAAAALPAAFDFSAKKLRENLEDLITTFEVFKKQQASRQGLSVGFAGADIIQQAKDFERLSEIQQQAIKNLTELAKKVGENSDILKPYKDNLQAVTVEMERLALAAKSKEIASLQKFFDVSNKIADASGRSVALQKKRLEISSRNSLQILAAGGESFQGLELNEAEINIRRQQVRDLIKQIDQANRNAEAHGGPAGLTNEEQIAKIQSLRESLQENLNSLRDLELQRLQDVFKLEEDITKEKVKQREEAAKAIGLLSGEEKIGLLTELGRNRGPISFEQQFFANAETNRLNQQFLPGRLQPGLNPVLPFDKRFIDAGIGISRENLAAEKALQDLINRAGGRQAFIDEQIRRAQQAGIQQQEIEQGVRAPGNNIKAEDVVNNFLKNLDLNLRVDEIDFQPLVNQFQDVVTHINELQTEVVEAIRDIWREVDPIIKHNNIPQVRNED